MLGLEFSHITYLCWGIRFCPYVADQNMAGMSSMSLYKKRHLKIIRAAHIQTYTEVHLCAVIQKTIGCVLKYSTVVTLISNIQYIFPATCIKTFKLFKWPVQLAVQVIRKANLYNIVV